MVLLLNLITEDSGRTYFADTSLTWNGEKATSDAPKSFSCSAESEEIVTTHHRILLVDSKMLEGVYNFIVDLTYEDNGQIIDAGLTTIEKFNLRE